MKFIIAGGGIGGLVSALALHAKGHDVCVFEAAETIRPLGVGINLLPHAARALEALGLLEAILALGVATRELAYFNRHGQRIWSEPRGLAAGYPWPQISVHRGLLQKQLLDAAQHRLPPGSIQTDRRLTCFKNRHGVRAEFTNGAGQLFDASGDVLIAADGIHSAARRAMYAKEGAPVFSGRVLWLATSRARGFLTGASMIMAGHQDQKFVAYPIDQPDRDGTCTINWIAELRREEPLERENWNRRGSLDDFLPHFLNWQYDWLNVPRLIEAAEAVYEFPMVDRDPLPLWTDGHVTLLGDAAHPMYPIGSNGASQAILDAAALAEAFTHDADATRALAAYEAARRPATSAIVIANRGNGPEQCMQLAEERAPSGFAAVEEVFEEGELQAIAARYKQVAGFDPQQLAAAP